jgi:hypothetical protein
MPRAIIAADIYLPTVIAEIDEFGWKEVSILGTKAVALMLDMEHQLSFYFYDAERIMRDRDLAPETGEGRFMLSAQDLNLLSLKAKVASIPMDELMDELKVIALQVPRDTLLRRLRHRLQKINLPGFRGKYDRIP